MNDSATPKSIPADDHPSAGILVVDMDGTLLRTDVLFESVAALPKRPWSLFVVMVALLRGRPAMKAAMARHIDLDVDQLPANAELVDWLGRQRAAGRRLALYSASNDELVARVARRFGIFEFAQGSDGRTNLAGIERAKPSKPVTGWRFPMLAIAAATCPYGGDAARLSWWATWIACAVRLSER